MRNILALARRILQQLAHDKRTIAMFILAPILVLWLFSVLLDTGTYHPHLAYVNLPDELRDALIDEGAALRQCADTQSAQALLEKGEVDAVLTLQDAVLGIQVEGSDPGRTASVLSTVTSAVRAASINQRDGLQKKIEQQIDGMKAQMESLKDKLSSLPSLPPIELPDFGAIEIDVQALVADTTIRYLHGDESWGSFDFFGPVFIGIFIFIFVFITSGMSLVTERTGGTMERLLVTPIKPYQLVSGFCLGFGVVTIVQTALVLWACVSLIGFPNEGSLALVILVGFSMALVSLTLGLVISAVAKTPFQVIQFMLILVIPQVLLSGIFDLSNAPAWMQVLSSCFPISYGAEALRDIMLRGAGFTDIGLNLGILWGFIAVFFALATVSFHRRKTR